VEGFVKIISVSLKNFASYESLDFDFQNQGLTLIQGSTGAGKSTLCDAIPYVLFGTTAKNGPVNDILSWHGGVTKGIIVFEDGSGITRIRGSKAKDNDLYMFEHASSEEIRGKDITDSQRLINQKLGFVAETYLAGAYLHEFSQTAQFFTTTAKNRRLICEQLVDLSFPKTLHEKSNVSRKTKEKELTELQKNHEKLQLGIDYLTSTIQTTDKMAEEWMKSRKNKVLELATKRDNFADDQAKRLKELYKEEYVILTKIDRLSLKEERGHIVNELLSLPESVCKECGASTHSEKKHRLEIKLRDLDRDIRDEEANKSVLKKLQTTIHDHKTATNVYADQITDLMNEKNPYVSIPMYAKLEKMELEEAGLRLNIETMQSDILDLELLSDITNILRSELITSVINQIEDNTNALLAKHFDAEIRVNFTTSDADKLEVSITKDGNEASFTQLSKGQRCILKLCFGVSVMKAIGNHHGVHFDQIFCDEATDGLSEDLKVKACGLLETLALEHGSVFLVDHSPSLKGLISNQISVTLEDGKSKLTKI
jgi:DNA repair ATPase RecN